MGEALCGGNWIGKGGTDPLVEPMFQVFQAPVAGPRHGLSHAPTSTTLPQEIMP
jgi:hypothetical protein